MPPNSMPLTPRHPLLAAALLGLFAWPALATPPALPLPAGAVETAARTEAPASIRLPSGGFDGTSVPMRLAEGQLDQRAYRLDGWRDTTLALLQPLTEALESQGWALVFVCDTGACGGFDFRYAMEVLPEPDMHVDLGDFRYLLAEDGKGGLVSLLVSRSLDQGYVQITSLSLGGSAPLVVPQPSAAVVQPEAPALAPAPAQPTAAPAGLEAQLQARGSAALDDLVFASGKADLAAGDYPSLVALAAWLAADPLRQITLVGHTDATGPLPGNIALSRARAEAVRARLVQGLGADGARIAAEGAGYLAPRASNQTPEGRQANRRVEVMVSSVAPQ